MPVAFFGWKESGCVPSPLVIEDKKYVDEVALGGNHVLLRSGQRVFSWGGNDQGQLGLVHRRDVDTAVEAVSSLGGVVQVSAGGSHSVALSQIHGGVAFSWGAGDSGQLAINATDPTKRRAEQVYDQRAKATPTICREFRRLQIQVAFVSCGEEHTLFLMNQGSVFAAGSGVRGQLGLPLGRMGFSQDSPLVYVPLEVKTLSPIPIARVACGGQHSLAVTHTGAVYAWGYNSRGQTGQELDVKTVWTPRRVAVFQHVAQGTGDQSTADHRRVIDASAGDNFSALLTATGQVRMFGANNQGQLGQGSALDAKSVTAGGLAADVPDGKITEGGGSGSGSGAGVGSGLQHSCVPLAVSALDELDEKVCQVSCGQSHVLVRTCSQRVYAWGASSEGQLGLGSGLSDAVSFVSRPSVVPLTAELLQPPSSDDAALSSSVSALRVLSVAGGNCTSAVSFCLESTPSSGDKKVTRPRSRSTLSPVSRVRGFFDSREFGMLLRAIAADKSNLALQDNLFAYLALCFRNLSALNGSFLSTSGSGINHALLEEVFTTVFSLSVELKSDKFSRMIVRALSSAIDTLEQYLVKGHTAILRDETVARCLVIALQSPHLHLARHQDLVFVSQVSTCLFRLPASVRRHVIAWLSDCPPFIFGARFVQMLLRILTNQLVKQKPRIAAQSQPTEVDRDAVAVVMLLQLLSKVNEQQSTGSRIVHPRTFYLPHMEELVDLQNDYFLWRTKPPTLAQARPFSFAANGPFLLDPIAKGRYLHIEVEHERQHRMTIAALVGTDDPILSVKIRRMPQHLISDSLRALPSSLKRWELCRPLKVTFEGEAGTDLGGLTRDYLTLAIETLYRGTSRRQRAAGTSDALDLKDAKKQSTSAPAAGEPAAAVPSSLDSSDQLFAYHAERRMMWYTQHALYSDALSDRYRLFGVLLGLALTNKVNFYLHFPSLFYKALLSQSVTSVDLEALDERLAKSLRQLLEYEGDVENDFCLTFRVAVYGNTDSRSPDDQAAGGYDLLPDGANIAVTASNRQSFVDLYTDYVINGSIRQPQSAVVAGFNSVLGDSEAIKLFSASELRFLVCGSAQLSISDWERVAVYEGFDPASPFIRAFWHILSKELSPAQIRTFLNFVTGSSRPPLGGLAKLPLLIQRAGPDTNQLPTSRTCFNTLLLPQYSSADKLKNRLLVVLNQGEFSFGLE